MAKKNPKHKGPTPKKKIHVEIRCEGCKSLSSYAPGDCPCCGFPYGTYELTRK